MTTGVTDYAMLEKWSPVTHQHLSVEDILMDVPTLLEKLPGRAKKRLLLMNTFLRHATQGVITSITIPEHDQSSQQGPSHLSLLVKGNFTQLQRLNLHSVDLSSTARTLVSRQWPQLTCLELCSCKLGNAGVALLAEGDWPMLQHLGLADNAVDEAAAAALIRNRWTQLTSLDVSHNMIEAKAMGELIKNDWTMLKKLRLDWNEMLPHDQAYSHLAQAQWPLEQLDLRYDKVNATIMSHLIQASWHSMKYLDLRNNKLDTKAISALVNGKLPLLETLLLGNNNLLPRAFTVLAQGQWPLLEFLDLGETVMQREGLRHLTQGRWSNLRSLIIGDVLVNASDLLLILMAPWPALRNLDVSHNNIGQTIAERFVAIARETCPHIRSILTCQAFNKCCGKCPYSRGRVPCFSALSCPLSLSPSGEQLS